MKCKEKIENNNYIITSTSNIIHTLCIENLVNENKDQSLDDLLEKIANDFFNEQLSEYIMQNKEDDIAIEDVEDTKED